MRPDYLGNSVMSSEPLQRLADSYLDHVLIALRADDRGVNLRDFLDPWWVYSRGGHFVRHRRGGGYSPYSFNRPCPVEHRQRLLQFDWLSDAASERLAARTSDKC